MQPSAPWSRVVAPPPPPSLLQPGAPALDPLQVAAALASKLAVLAGSPPPAPPGAPPAAAPQTFSKAKSQGAPFGSDKEDIASRIRSQLLNRPELRNALQEANKRLQEEEAQKKQAEEAAAAEAAAAEANKASEEPAADAAGSDVAQAASDADVADKLDESGTASAAEKSNDAEAADEDEKQDDQEAEADAADPADAEGHDEESGEGHIPWPPADAIHFSRKALSEAAAAAKTLLSENPDRDDHDVIVEAAAIAALEAMRSQGRLPEEASIPQPMAASRRAASDSAADEKMEQATAAPAVSSEANPSSSADATSPPSDQVLAQARPDEVRDSQTPKAVFAKPPGPPPGLPPGLQSGPLDLKAALPDGAAAVQDAQAQAPQPQQASPSKQSAALVSFIAKVEEGPKGERIYRYSLGPGADIEGCFRNVRRRIEVELEDGLTVQMCLQKRTAAAVH